MVGGAFAASVNRLFNMAERQASTLESLIRGRHVYKQIWRPLVGEILTLERKDVTNSLSVFSSMLLSLAMFLESFRGCFGTFLGMERPSLVKLPIEESVVKVLHSASSLCSLYY